jgi:hypothetical protein
VIEVCKGAGQSRGFTEGNKANEAGILCKEEDPAEAQEGAEKKIGHELKMPLLSLKFFPSGFYKDFALMALEGILHWRGEATLPQNTTTPNHSSMGRE